MLRARISCHANVLARVSNATSHAPLLSSSPAVKANSSPSSNSCRGVRPHSSTLTNIRPLSTTLNHSANKSPCNASILHSRYFATKSKRSKKRKTEAEPDRVPAYVETLIHLRNAITDGNVPAITDAYSVLRGTLRLGGEDVGAIAQSLHAAFRKNRPRPEDKTRQAELLHLADLLVADIRANRLPPNYAAHLHLLAFYKEFSQLDKAVEFWEWLVRQDDSYVNSAVYGVALEVLAVQGRPAEDTEALYLQALRRFPGSFNEYHLSPDAVLPDRSQPFNVSGIPVTLLQGIVTARLLRGASRHAYLALDTALRLFPAQLPSRFFTLFVEERPVTEAYRVFIMACRSGTAVGPDCLKALLTKLRHVAVADPVANASALRSTLTASYAFAASGASLTSNHLTELVIAVTSILHHPVISSVTKEDINQLAEHVMLLVSRLFDIWAGQDVRPGIAAFNSIITNIAGKGQRKDIIETCLGDMQALSLEPSAVTHRSLLTAAGDIGDADMLQSTWLGLSTFRKSAGARLDIGDWQSLAKAARKAGQIAFAQEQLTNAETSMHPALVSRINGLLQEQKRPAPNETKASLENVRNLIGTMLQDTLYMEEQLEFARFRDFKADPVPTSLLVSKQDELGSDEQLREIYDDLSADKIFSDMEVHDVEQDSEHNLDQDPEQTVSEPEDKAPVDGPIAETQPALSPTGFEYDELRFQNWKTINELLAESEQHDQEYIAAVDAAIQKGVVPPKRGSGWVTPATIGPSLGLSDLATSKTTTSSGDSSKVLHDESLRDRIVSLRAKLE